MKNRDDIKEFVLQIEKQFPVNAWKFNDIHLWPLLRLELFFFIRKELYHEKKAVTPKAAVAKMNPLMARIKDLSVRIKAANRYKRFLDSLTKKDFVFIAQNEHRINYKGTNYNRFFDTLIEENDLNQRAAFVEFGNKPLNTLANNNIVYSYKEIVSDYKGYRSLKTELKNGETIELNLEGYHELLDFLSQNDAAKGFAKKFTVNHITNTIAKEYALRIRLFTDVFSKIRPKKLIALCYYSDLAIIAAANKLGIETLDMQHGAQATSHLAYGSWSVIPEEGYDFLPRTFWNWDAQSKAVIDSWAHTNKLYKSFVGGNVWMNYWMNNKDTYPSKDFILYTLQPDSLTLDQLFPQGLIKAISGQKQKWFIRFHPRQMNEAPKIKEYLAGHGILDLVNIDQATTDPLPILLKNCLIHITNSSASTIEASLFGKKSVLLHEIGRSYYAELIAEKKAQFIAPDQNFETGLNDFISNLSNEQKSDSIVFDNALIFN